MSVPNTVLWFAKRIENLEFSPMSEIRRKVQQCKAVIMFVSEWFYKLSHLSVMLMSVYSINAGYQGLKGPLITTTGENTSSRTQLPWCTEAAQMHFFLTDVCQKRLKITFSRVLSPSINIILVSYRKTSESKTMLQHIIRSSSAGLMSQAAVVVFYDFAYMWKMCNCIMTLKCPIRVRNPRAAWPASTPLNLLWQTPLESLL